MDTKQLGPFIAERRKELGMTQAQLAEKLHNPPGARGEDTFLSTCLSDRKVVKIPCYAFHDGFSTYKHLLEGVLPIKLKFITADNEKTLIDFIGHASVGFATNRFSS